LKNRFVGRQKLGLLAAKNSVCWPPNKFMFINKLPRLTSSQAIERERDFLDNPLIYNVIINFKNSRVYIKNSLFLAQNRLF